MKTERENPQGPDSVWHVVGQHAGWGLTIAVSIGLFLWLGYEADRRLGTLPFLTILGAFVGGAAAFYSMFRQLVIEPRETAESRPAPEENEEAR
jgi:F0F1-type ATP synthase assembly protein I